MRAVLIATGFHTALEPIIHYRPSPLFRIVDKPLIIHIIEFLSRHGITHCDLVLRHLPEMIEATLEEGLRWGMHITYHLAKDAHHPYDVLAFVAQEWKDELVLLGKGDVLPELPAAIFQQTAPIIPTLFYYPSNEWSGWSLLPASLLRALSSFVSEDILLKKVKAKIQ